MKYILIFLSIVLSLSVETSNAQYTNNIWCFGDSAGIDFNTCPPSAISSGMLARNGSSTISDINGNLLFYAYGYDYYLENLGYRRSGIVKNKLHQTMLNGDSLTAQWYHDIIIIPKSVTDSTFYIFCAGVSSDYGLYYSIVDLKQQGGLGEIVQKNIQLQNFPVFDGLTAVKHGNGKDWWLIFQRWESVGVSLNNEFYVYKIDSLGIGAVNLQNVGSLHDNGGGDLSFSKKGDKLIYAEWKGMIELYDFDRNSGIISNPINIEPERSVGPFPYYTSAVLSPNARFLYIAYYREANNHLYNQLLQYDLTSGNIASSKLIIDSFPDHTGIWGMESAPDGKIYLSAMAETINYPFADTVHTNVTDNLSVINYPDSLATACDFQPFSFYLGARRTYYGLPNNPDYTMGQSVHNPCDSLTTIHEIKASNKFNELKIFYHPQFDIAFINAEKLNGKNYTLTLFDITGKLIYRENGNLNSQYFTKDLNMQGFAKGMYVSKLDTDKEKLVKRFVKY